MSETPGRHVRGRPHDDTTAPVRFHCVFGRDGRLIESARFRVAGTEPEEGAVQPLLALMDPGTRDRLHEAVRTTTPGAETGPLHLPLCGPHHTETTVAWSLLGGKDRVLATAEVHAAPPGMRPDDTGRFFDRIDLPAFVLDNGMDVRTANHAARTLFPDIAPGAAWAAQVAPAGEADRLAQVLTEWASSDPSDHTFRTGSPDDAGAYVWHVRPFGSTAFGAPQGFYAIGFGEPAHQQGIGDAQATALDAPEASTAAFTREVLSDAAHGLRAPLTPLQASVQILRDRVDTRFDETAEIAMETLELQIRRLADLVADIRDVSARENQALRLWSDAFDLSRTVRTEAGRHTERASRNSIDLQVRIQDGLLAEADPARIARALRHLIADAFSRVPSGGRIRVRAAHEDGHAIVRVHHSDPPGGETARGPRGTGLGLVFCKHIIEAMGGEIWHDLGLHGDGTETAFSLPLAVPAPDPPADEDRAGRRYTARIGRAVAAASAAAAPLGEDVLGDLLDSDDVPYSPT